MKYRVRHRSTYRYRRRVDLAQHVIRLMPRPLPWQSVLASEIKVEPIPTARGEGADYFGNRVTFVAVETAHDRFSVELDATVDVAVPEPTGPDPAISWQSVCERLREGGGRELLEAGEFTYDSPLAAPDPAVADYAVSSFPPGRPLLEAVAELTSRIHRDFVFDPTATVVATPLAEVMQQRRGVCQDFAHL
ncbi:MAG TPA: transglutaminase N-terminal domain-containing protein, partial [Stellaceae bacterium]|nr:transglutaminase N-terminal domain-containing protein [Stellaceae bacterium]